MPFPVLSMNDPMAAFDVMPLRHQRDLQRLRQQQPYFSGTLAKGFMVLQRLASDPRPQANSELARALGMPRPTVSRLCRSLALLGLLDHDPSSDRYAIGPAALTLGYPYQVNTPWLSSLRPLMQALATRAQGAVSLGVVTEGDVVYIETCAHEGGTLLRPASGAVHGVLETAMGRAWLASLPEPDLLITLLRLRELRPQEYARCAEQVQDSLQHQEERGFAVNFGDAGLGVWALGMASRLRYGPRTLLFNCAVQGVHWTRTGLMRHLGPSLTQLVEAANRLRRIDS